MKALPDIRYVRSRDVSIGYMRWGQGKHQVVFTPPLVSNVELMWELPEWERMLEWAGQHHEIIMIDKRGVGLSDRVTEPSTLDDYVLDVLAVMDAEGVESSNIVGHSEGGAIAAALAAMHPKRVRRLCLMDAPALGVSQEFIRSFADPDHRPQSAGDQREMVMSLVQTWGKPESVWLEIFAPSVADDARVRRWWERFERQSCSSGSLLAMFRSMATFDLAPLLPRINAPTLVCHSLGDRVVPIIDGRAIAALIPGAKLIEWANADHMWSFTPNWRDAQNDIIEFLTGTRPGAGARKRIVTVLFTDIFDSTKTASELGDTEWRKVIELHDSISRLRVSAYNGTTVKSTGDGTLAVFDEPASAVSAAIDLSRELAASGIAIRAGLHIGQVEVQD
ncbi:MAG: adenylate/guanylate cyclase domain-containing protein, partial [Hyphomicrobiaceae bacterium]